MAIFLLDDDARRGRFSTKFRSTFELDAVFGCQGALSLVGDVFRFLAGKGYTILYIFSRLLLLDLQDIQLITFIEGFVWITASLTYV